MSSIEEKIQALPLDLQGEVADFVAFLQKRQQAIVPGTPAIKWAGALDDMAQDYTSVELQHLLADWRTPHP